MSAPAHHPSRKRNYDALLSCVDAWIISGPRLVRPNHPPSNPPHPTTLKENEFPRLVGRQDVSSEAVCVIPRNWCDVVLVLRSVDIPQLPGLFKRRDCCTEATVVSVSRSLRKSDVTWIISGPSLVQKQAALNEAVCIILRIQGSEVFGLRSGRP